MKKEQVAIAVQRALTYFEQAGVVLSDDEKNRIEITDFGLNELESMGLALLTYVNTDRCCAKEFVLFPYQTCPEHRHPPVGDEPGKEETFRCRYGSIYLHIEGEPTRNPQAKPPAGRELHYTARKEMVLLSGDQFTLQPNTKHWFQAGPAGAVVSEFSTRSRDELDVFTDPQIKRVPDMEI